MLRDDELLTVVLPDDLRYALAGDADAGPAFDGLSPSHQREYVEWITEAKREGTRRRRIERTLELLRAGRSAR